MANVSFYRKGASETPPTTEGAITFRDNAGIFIGTGTSYKQCASYVTMSRSSTGIHFNINGTTQYIIKCIADASEATEDGVLYIVMG